MSEQPNPWELLHPQDAMSRHRGAKPPRRCGRSGEISLFNRYLRLDYTFIHWANQWRRRVIVPVDLPTSLRQQ